MDEIEWWEVDSAKDMSEQAAGDIAFVIESALEAHGGARLALSADKDAEPVHAKLAQSKGMDWSKISILPTDDRLVPLDDPLSRYRALEGWFAAKGAEMVSLVDEAALGDRQEAGRLADARL
ncbi:MAG: 6-phosphogluconolactonase, partial [Sphingomonadales bacterium]|nr:6-phosphogluconolactonase [Sphingomonadales bacterium]